MAISKAAIPATFLLILAILLPSCSQPAPAPKPPVVEPTPDPPQPAPVVPPPAPPAPVPAPPAPAPAPVPANPTPGATLVLEPYPALLGTWRGTGVSYWIDGGTGRRTVKVTWDVTLNITGFNGRAPVGTWAMRDIKHENLGNVNEPVQNFGPSAITNSEAGDTRLYFRVVNDPWRWEFTYTTDLMSGHFTSQWPNQCDPKAFVLNKLRRD